MQCFRYLQVDTIEHCKIKCFANNSVIAKGRKKQPYVMYEKYFGLPVKSVPVRFNESSSRQDRFRVKKKKSPVLEIKVAKPIVQMKRGTKFFPRRETRPDDKNKRRKIVV